ncbi:MAG: hypothetical protein ACE5KM_15015 [Planctomycetaceae bacterium]
MENKRTKYLAIALFGLIGLWIVQKGLYSFVIDPITSKGREIESLDRRLHEAELKRQLVNRAARTRNDYTRRSLPPDALDGQRLYKEWVHDLADAVGFDDLEVEAGRRERRFVGRSRGRNRKPLYTAVHVTLDGKTTFDRLCRFLYYFHRTDIPHHVSELTVISEGNEGNPLMKVKMTVEALAFSKAKSRSRLFAECELKHALAGGPRYLGGPGTDEFPKKGAFHVCVGKRLLTVTERKDGRWKVRPGIDPPPQSDDDDLPKAKAGDTVELVPLTKSPERLLADYRSAVFGPGRNPFVLPVPPRLQVDDRTVVRGETLRLLVRASDLNLGKATPTFKLFGAPKGMTITKADNVRDRDTATIEWKPQKSDESKTYRIEVALFRGSAKTPLLRKTARIKLVDPNEPPTLVVVSKHTGFLGDPIAFEAMGKDPEGGRLNFSLANAPQGAEIDSSGRFTWTPSESLDAKDYAFEIVVTDEGEPAKHDRKEVVIVLRENAERYTKLIAIISDAGRREAWLYDISRKKKTVVFEGSQFQAGGLAGFVYVIGQDFLEFQTAEGGSYRLSLGRFLAKRERLQAKQALAPRKATVTSAKKPR